MTFLTIKTKTIIIIILTDGLSKCDRFFSQSVISEFWQITQLMSLKTNDFIAKNNKSLIGISTKY